MSEFIFALGLVAVIEGLVLVLVPSRFEDLVRALESMSHDRRRMLGLLFVAIGVATVWAVKSV
jgi:uncharacterized protein YjeT (DUF2065 family)